MFQVQLRPKPIPVVYRGTPFKSTGEARWAVFFDTLGIQYVYEPERFNLDGMSYRPDFYIPEQDIWFPREACWVEVKGFRQGIDDTLLHKLQRHTQKRVFMFDSTIRYVPYHNGDKNMILEYWYADAEVKHFIFSNRYFIEGPCEHHGYHVGITDTTPWHWQTFSTPRLDAAYATARHYHFEEGK